jgi:hypothetical protein
VFLKLQKVTNSMAYGTLGYNSAFTTYVARISQVKLKLSKRFIYTEFFSWNSD